MPAITNQAIFLPTRDLAESIDFYVRMGWSIGFREEKLALVKSGPAHFLLQAYYQANNTMVHLVVDDATAWHETAERVKQEGAFDKVKVHSPVREAYGALVTHVIDPAGVLLHFAQMDEA